MVEESHERFRFAFSFQVRSADRLRYAEREGLDGASPRQTGAPVVERLVEEELTPSFPELP